MASTEPGPAPHPLLHTLVPLASFHPVRTASHSSLHSLVAFSLSHLSQPACPPLVLHTLPPATTHPSLDPAVAALPKLVSLHQLVLRTSPAPLHSYTLVDSFERNGIASPSKSTDATSADAADDDEREQMRQDLVALEWLSGRAGSNRRPRRKHTPLMLIVVSPVPLSLPSSFTHQPPPRPSRSAKRALKRPAPAAPAAPPAPAPAPAPATAPTAAPPPDADEGDEPGAKEAEAGAGAGGAEGGDEARRKRRKRRRGKGGRAGAAGKGGGKGEGAVEGGETSGMDVDAAPGA
ncbi:hypothetical protein JCM8208_006821 [Rhodotorula glutinis]